MCSISFVPVRAVCEMIGVGISVLIQVRSEGSATWDLVGTGMLYENSFLLSWYRDRQHYTTN